MRLFKRTALCLLATVCAGLVSTANARVGTYDIGYGTKAKGMGGLAVALPQDSLVGAINPAGMSWIDDRQDIGLEFLTPPRIYTTRGGFNGTAKYRGYPLFKLIPHAGIIRTINENSCWGISVYGAGGQTVYRRNNIIASGGLDVNRYKKLGLELAQIFTSFNYSYAFNQNQSVGASLIWATQMLRIRGLFGFDNALRSVAPGSVTNRNWDYGNGVGFRIGYLGRVLPDVLVGASYTTKISMTPMSRYKGVVTDKGKLDIPAILAAGITWKATSQTNLGFEYQRIFYADIPLWHNSFTRFNACPGGTELAGAKNGPGFGWNNLDVYKVGADYAYDQDWTFRLGWTLSRPPYPGTELDVNVLTQNLGRHHITFGTTYVFPWGAELDFSYFYMLPTTRTGPSQLTLTLGTIHQRMYQHGFEFSLGQKF
jgi:long-chain fatty acid transport protein